MGYIVDLLVFGVRISTLELLGCAVVCAGGLFVFQRAKTDLYMHDDSTSATADLEVPLISQSYIDIDQYSY